MAVRHRTKQSQLLQPNCTPGECQVIRKRSHPRSAGWTVIRRNEQFKPTRGRPLDSLRCGTLGAQRSCRWPCAAVRIVAHSAERVRGHRGGRHVLVRCNAFRTMVSTDARDHGSRLFASLMGGSCKTRAPGPSYIRGKQGLPRAVHYSQHRTRGRPVQSTAAIYSTACHTCAPSCPCSRRSSQLLAAR